jgi:hypothetical protein
VRAAAVAGTLGLAGAYAFEAARYHRAGAKGFELERPPAPGTPDFLARWRARPLSARAKELGSALLRREL